LGRDVEGNRKESMEEGTAASWKGDDIRLDLQEGSRTGDREANSQIFRHYSRTEGLDIMEGSVPSETKKKTAHIVGAGNVGAPGILDSFGPTDWKYRKMVIHLDRLVPYQ
jgi:hypothetical protein